MSNFAFLQNTIVMNEKNEIVLNKKLLLRVLLSITLALVTFLGVHHTGNMTVQREGTDEYEPTYFLNTLGVFSYYESRSWSNENKKQQIITGWKAINSYSANPILKSVNSPSYMEKLRY